MLSELKQQLLSRLFDLRFYACTNPGGLGRANSLLLTHCVISGREYPDLILNNSDPQNGEDRTCFRDLL